MANPPAIDVPMAIDAIIAGPLSLDGKHQALRELADEVGLELAFDAVCDLLLVCMRVLAKRPSVAEPAEGDAA